MVRILYRDASIVSKLKKNLTETLLSPGMFCSGADLTMAQQIADSDSGERFSYLMQSVLTSLHNLHIPSFALLQGT